MSFLNPPSFRFLLSDQRRACVSMCVCVSNDKNKNDYGNEREKGADLLSHHNDMAEKKSFSLNIIEINST